MISLRLLYPTLFVILCKFNDIKATETVRIEEIMPQRTARAALVSFKPIGEDVAVGLDFELPFVKVPIKKHKDKYGNEAAMVNINTASLVTSGLLAGCSLVVAHLLRSFGLLRGGSKEAKEKENDTEKSSRGIPHEPNMKHVFDYFKLIYRNDTGERVETTLPRLFARIEETFLENDIDLAACMQKSICSSVYKASENVRLGHATGLQKIVDGMSSYSWVLNALQPYSELRAAIEAGKRTSHLDCNKQYSGCKWHEPEQKLSELIKTYVNFT